MDAMVCGDVPACTEPTNLTVSNITTSEAEIAWTAGADETAWTVEYRPANSESWTAAQVAEPNFVLNGLNANTAYVVRVAANCGTTNSEYIAVNFTTLPSCLAPTNITNINNFRGRSRSEGVVSSLSEVLVRGICQTASLQFFRIAGYAVSELY